MTKTFTDRQGNPTLIQVQRTIGDPAREQVTLIFEWTGGPYVDVKRIGRHAVEVINVCGRGSKPTIPFTQQALIAKVDEWIREYGRAQLLHDVTQNWYV